MNNKLEFYIDLDNTLIHAAWGGNPNKRRTKIDLGSKEVYWSMLRPHALDFLAFCREIAPTYMLTHAHRDYALEHNKVFALGFTDDQLIARDDFSYTKSGMLIDTTRPIKINVSPGAILVDDNPPKDEMAVVKIQYLGINTDRYVQGRDYRGGKDPENFDKEIDKIKKIIGFPFHKNSYTISV
jgi:hypothetical protein